MNDQDLSLLRRILPKLAEYPTDTDSCWNWNGARSNNQPRIGIGRSSRPVRKIIFRLFSGLQSRPYSMRCQNLDCINPWHMDPLVDTTAKEISRARQGLIPFRISRHCCKRGHPIRGRNILKGKTKRKAKVYPTERCRLCVYEYQQAYHRKSFAKAIEKLKEELGLV